MTERKTMTQKNNDLTKWITIVVVIITLISGYIWNVSAMASRLSVNEKTDDEVHKTLIECTKENRENILRMQSDLTYIRKSVDELKEKK